MLAKVEKFTKAPRGDSHKYIAHMKDGSKVAFGSRDYEQYKDSVPANMGGGAWSHKNHSDKTRRENYRARHSKILLTVGTPAYKKKYSPAWFSYHYLW